MPRRIALSLTALVAVAGCGQSSVRYVCDPACPSGFVCTAAGCTPTGAPPPADMQRPVADLTGGCTPACSGTTPHCNADRLCVACLIDTDCPLGQICQRQGAVTLCVAGCTDDARCPTGGAGSTPRCCTGQCTDSSNDPGNCGDCGTTCKAPQATALCTAGVCALGDCTTSWQDCNHDPADGCEVEVVSDVLNCGACGGACHIAHATAGCSNGCYIRACDFGQDDCNSDATDGCETPTLSDKKNCGGCGQTCTTPPHATVDCLNAACQLTSCQAGFADCDGSAANGCEVEVAIDLANCGHCGTACGQGLVCKNGGCTCQKCDFPHATSTCRNQVCAIDKCSAGFADCNRDPKDGCEVAVASDPSNCGGCGVVCQGGLFCIGGACIMTSCGDGILEADEEVDPPVSPFMSLLVDQVTCRWDMQNVAQLYCNGACTWAGAMDCDQADADLFCQLRTGNPLSTANSFTHTTATNDPGFPCFLMPFGVDIGPLPSRGVNTRVPYQDSSILANHGAGNVITKPDCTDP